MLSPKLLDFGQIRTCFISCGRHPHCARGPKRLPNPLTLLLGSKAGGADREKLGAQTIIKGYNEVVLRSADDGTHR